MARLFTGRIGAGHPTVAIAGNPGARAALSGLRNEMEATMGFGRGALLWLLGVPLPIIILLALFWR